MLGGNDHGFCPLYIGRVINNIATMNLNYLVANAILKAFHCGNCHNHRSNAQRNSGYCQTHHIFGEGIAPTPHESKRYEFNPRHYYIQR